MDEVACEEAADERWSPLGASNDEEQSFSNSNTLYSECCEHPHCMYLAEKFEDKLKSLEDEQELLNSSLSALTTHFAQVQFRLRQAVAAPQADKESLLKSLEEFAFRGIPEVGVMRERLDEASVTEEMWSRRVQQQQLIEKLKSQIRELEIFTLGNEDQLLRDVIEQNQKVLVNEIKSRLNLECDDWADRDIKQQIDAALDHVVAPLKVKEEFVMQLQNEVADLERFIDYLKSNQKHAIFTCNQISKCSLFQKPIKSANDRIGLARRAAALLHMLTVLYFPFDFHFGNKDHLKHWGGLRARLEIAIARVLEATKERKNRKLSKQKHLHNKSFLVTKLVRKDLAGSIRDLMQHGACEENSLYRMVPFVGCIRQRVKKPNPVHAWQIILKYYQLREGDKFNSRPSTKLSQSFDLDIAGNSGQSKSKNILFAIGNIASTHTLYKQSFNTQFKAFVCAALNANMLASWLQLIFQCSSLLERHYQSWSYAKKTKFSDAVQSLDAFTQVEFDLPVDFSIHRFRNMHDVFM